MAKPILVYHGQNHSSILYDLGHTITSFIDNSLLLGNMEQVIAYVTDTLTFDSLGFAIRDEKSQSEPTQELTYLGIVVN